MTRILDQTQVGNNNKRASDRVFHYSFVTVEPSAGTTVVLILTGTKCWNLREASMALLFYGLDVFSFFRIMCSTLS